LRRCCNQIGKAKRLRPGTHARILIENGNLFCRFELPGRTRDRRADQACTDN
jgi:hypothetical protein